MCVDAEELGAGEYFLHMRAVECLQVVERIGRLRVGQLVDEVSHALVLLTRPGAHEHVVRRRLVRTAHYVRVDKERIVLVLFAVEGCLEKRDSVELGDEKAAVTYDTNKAKKKQIILNFLVSNITF